MSKKRRKKVKKVVLPDGHKLVTRRDFLAHGLVGASSYVMMPSILGNLFGGSQAIAETIDCGTGAVGSNPMLPFLLIDGAGGNTNAGVVKVLGEDGNALSGDRPYRSLGINSNNPNTTGSAHGLPIIQDHGGDGFSGAYRALYENNWISAQARNAMQVSAIAGRSGNDTSNNMHNPLGLMSQAGSVGGIFPSPLGTRNSASGARAKGVVDIPEYRPIAIRRASDINNAVTMGQTINSNLNTDQRNVLARGLASLSDSQVNRLNRSDLVDQFKKLTKCGFIKNQGLAGDPSDPASVAYQVNPNNNAQVQQTWNLGANDASSRMSNGSREQRAAVVYNVLAGRSGPGAIEIGGCDYHNGSNTGEARHGDNKDLEIWEVVARTIELANKLGTSCMIGIITDGAAGVRTLGTRVWVSDSSSTASLLMIHYDHARAGNSVIGATGMRKLQLGHFNFDARNGRASVERDTYIGNDPSKQAIAMYLNWMALNDANAVAKIKAQISTQKFDHSQVENHLVWNPRNKS